MALPYRSKFSSRRTFLPKRAMQTLTAEDFTYNSFVCKILRGFLPNLLNLATLHIGGRGHFTSSSAAIEEQPTLGRGGVDASEGTTGDTFGGKLKAPTQARVACVKKGEMFCQCNPRICYSLLTAFEHRSTFTREAVGPLLSQIP